MNGDEIRATRFARGGLGGYGIVSIVRRDMGYDASEVDGLLRRVAAALDANRPAGSLIKNATFRKGSWPHYDIDSVDWFLDQLLLHPGHSELAGLSSDLWRDLPVAQVTRGGVSEPATHPGNRRKYFAGECADAWRDFGQHSGTYLRWERISGSTQPRRFKGELRTADQQTIVSLRGLHIMTVGWPPAMTISTAGRNWTVSTPKIPARSIVDSWPPGIADLAASSWRDDAGHFAAETMKNRAQQMEAHRVREVVDETGTPILYTSGHNYDGRAYARVTFPDQRWLRFLVRGTKRANAIMTAVDQAGNKVARYRDTSRRFHPGQTIEIAIHPDQKLTDELILAIAISAPWLDTYFTRPSQ